MAAARRLSLPLVLLVVLAVAGRAAAQDYDFFYLVLQWPGAYCDTKQSCCYPKSGKPAADFGIHGLWPNRDDGTYPQNCSPDNAFNPSKVHLHTRILPLPLPLFLSLSRAAPHVFDHAAAACSWVSSACQHVRTSFALCPHARRTLRFRLLALLLFIRRGLSVLLLAKEKKQNSDAD